MYTWLIISILFLTCWSIDKVFILIIFVATGLTGSLVIIVVKNPFKSLFNFFFDISFSSISKIQISYDSKSHTEYNEANKQESIILSGQYIITALIILNEILNCLILPSILQCTPPIRSNHWNRLSILWILLLIIWTESLRIHLCYSSIYFIIVIHFLKICVVFLLHSSYTCIYLIIIKLTLCIRVHRNLSILLQIS